MVDTVQARAPEPRAGCDRESDESLMERYRDGDGDAFEALYARHRGPLYRYVRRQCASAEVADEIFQDVWLRLVAARKRYRVRARFTTYLYRIARHRVIDHHRRAGHVLRRVSAAFPEAGEHREDAGGGPEPVGPPAPEHALEAARLRSRLRRALSELPGPQADAFLLHEEAGLSLEEIARVTGVGRETVKSRLRYAVARLREALGSG